jgi:sulfatase maturation enzyme AslB (radical SAM superfamily)
LLRYKKIFLGGRCNNNCVHCPSEHKDSPPVDNRAVRDLLEQQETDNIVLYGGEPTLRNDLMDLIHSARIKGCRRIKLVTNGRSFSNVNYLQQVINAGCSLFEITLWGSNPNIHEYLSRMPGSFWETINGLGNLSDIPHDKFVCVRIPICKENLSDIENTVMTALNMSVHRIILSMQDQNLSFQSALPHISNSINISIFNRVWILTEGIPFCLMQGLEPHISEICTGWETIYQRMFQKNKECIECLYRDLCPGPDSRYVQQFGKREFSPVRAGRHFEDIKTLYD